MKTTKNILIILTILSFTCQVKAEENYWQILKQIMMEKTPETGAKYKEYMDSLSINELIITARQCSEELDKVCPDSIFCERNVGTLMFFYYTYLQKDGLKNITPLFQEIENRSLTNFWRASLVEFLGDNDWRELMRAEQLYSIVDRTLVIISDKDEHARLRYEASKTAEDALEQLAKNNLLADPVIQKKLESGGQLKDLIKEVVNGKITLSDNYKQSQAKTMEYYDRYAQTLLPVLNEPELKPILQRGVLEGLTNSLGQKIDSASLGQQIDSVVQVQDVLEGAVRNYHRFDEDRWSYLIQIGYEDLHLPDSNDIAQNMLSDMQNKLEVEKDKKKKYRIKDKMGSLEWTIKQQKLKKPDDPNAAKDKNKDKD